jgi:hypothetical protein
MTMSTSLLRPVDQVDMPAPGLVATSVRRKEEERLMHCLRTFWSILSAVLDESLWLWRWQWWDWAKASVTNVAKSVLGG